MRNVLLIRRNEYDQLLWKEILDALPINLTDVNQPFQIIINNLDTDRHFDAKFLGKKLADFDKVLFLATPTWPENNDESSFAYSETEATLLSLFKLSGAPLLNIGIALTSNKVLHAPIPFCKFWERVGWIVPEIEYNYCNGKMQKKLIPDPGLHMVYTLYLSQNDYFTWPNYKVIFNDHSRFKNIIRNMQADMGSFQFDFLVFQFFESEGRFYLFSYISELVDQVDRVTLSNFIKRIIT